MKAIVIHAAKDLRVEEHDQVAPEPGEVRIDIQRGGICGTDLHYFQHGGFGPITLKEPMVLGHEVSGVIRELGDGVTGLSLGDLVAVSPSLPCGGCAYCLRGMPNHCLNMQFFGSAMPFPHIQGAFRQSLTTAAARCVTATGLSPDFAATAEPLAVVLHAIRQAGEVLGKTVLITGCGPIGLLAILVARRAGADRIIATDLADFPLSKARALGADEVINMADTPDALEPLGAGKGQVDILMECSGAQPALVGAIPALRPKAVIVQLGLGGDMTLPMMALTAKELSLKGSFRFHEEFATAVSLMQKGLIDVSPILTQTLPVSETHDAFSLAADRSAAIKVQIDFQA